METFLSAVAHDLLERFGTNLSDLVLVFPNKRAGLFMNQQLAALSPTPVWAPRYQTISDVFCSASSYNVCDPILAVCELYRIYAGKTAQPESLDRFYGWGEIILSDFDDIDKHLADARRLFSNIRAIKVLDDSAYLTKEQEEALSRFFKGFSIENNSRLKEKFLALWNIMYELYTELNASLRKQGLMYEGALYREVAERMRDEKETGPEPGKTYVFIGLNVLNEVEAQLFQALKDRQAALFYWDYDVFYTQAERTFEAGVFMRENLKRFPNELPESLFRNMEKSKQVDYISATSENAQARYLPQWLQNHLTTPEQETAVVLCNEALLQPVLHALPDNESGITIRHTNITMGFPLTDTPVYSLVNALVSLQTDGYNAESGRFLNSYREAVTNHPYGHRLEEAVWQQHPATNTELLDYLILLLEQLAASFRHTEQPDVYQQLYNEALFKTHSILTRFRSLVDSGVLNVEAVTLRRLLRTVLAGTTIPFHGEPAVGLQVMGVLETRNLDFRNIILLSVNEGQLPRHTSDTSFIPYALKEAFGLTTIRHKIAVYAFYFYRLLQRAEHITFLYNTSTEGSRQGEMSRFLRQLLAETEWDIRTFHLQAGQSVCTSQPLSVRKTDEVMRRLQNRFDSRVAGSHPLSPTALNYYLDCPLKFYLNQIARIRPKRDTTDGLDAAQFGTVFHKAAEAVYTRLQQRSPLVRAADLDILLEKPVLTLAPYVEEAFRDTFAEEGLEPPAFHGPLLVVRKVIITYLKQLLEHDRRLTPFEIVEMEQPHETTLRVDTPKGALHIRIGGTIDRIDRVTRTDESGTQQKVLRIVDYKTGGRPQSGKCMEQLTTPHKDRPNYIFQTFLYAMVMCGETQSPVMPALFFVNKSSQEDYTPAIRFGTGDVYDFHAWTHDFEQLLRATLEELFNPDLPFVQTDITETCQKCDYRRLCGK